MPNKKVIYTVITDAKCPRKECPVKCEGWDYVCFTTLDIKSDTWDIRQIDDDMTDMRKLSRKVKILNEVFLPGYDLSIYIDSKFTPISDLDKFVKTYLKHDIAVLKHKQRNCVYKESEFLIEKADKLGLSKVDIKIIKQQVLEYKDNGMPEMYGLWAPGIMIRRHNITDNFTFMNSWYLECLVYSYRDILSFAATKCAYNLTIDEMPFKEIYMRFTGR